MYKHTFIHEDPYTYKYTYICTHTCMHVHILIFDIYILCIYTGVNNHFSWSPGQVKFQAGQAYIFTQCPAGK